MRKISNLSGKKKKITIFSISTIISLLIVEAFVRYYYSEKNNSHLNSSPNYDKSCGYYDKDEYYGKFDNVSRMKFYSKAGYRPMPMWNGRGVFNNELGLRTKRSTSEINEVKDGVTLVSGGSTAFGAGVKQNDVFTNYMESTFTAGVGGYVFANEFSFLREVVGPKVNFNTWVSFSGWNDVYCAYKGYDYYLSPDMFQLKQVIYSSKFNSYWPKIDPKRVYEDYDFKLLWLLGKAFDRYVFNSRTGFDEIDGEETKMRYEDFWGMLSNEIAIASKWASASGRNFIYILQPSLYATRKKLSKNELCILNNNKKMHPKMVDYFEKTYKFIRRDIEDLSKKEKFVFLDSDLALEGLDSDVTIFVDHVHLGSKGNEALGKWMKKQMHPMKGLN